MSTPVISDNNAAYFQALQPGNFHQIASGAASVQSLVMDASTTIVRIFCTQDTWLNFGVNPTATASGSGAAKSGNILQRGGFVDFYGIKKSAGWQIAVIQDSSGGKVDITEGL